jgi:hypothetical protein
MATKYLIYPEPIFHLGVRTTLASVVDYICSLDDRFLKQAKGLYVGGRLTALFPLEDVGDPGDPTATPPRPPREPEKVPVGRVFEIRGDDHAFFAEALKEPTCGFPKLNGVNPQTGEPIQVELGFRLAPLLKAWADATDERPDEPSPAQPDQPTN